MSEPIVYSPVDLDELFTLSFGFDALKTCIKHILKNQSIHTAAIR